MSKGIDFVLPSDFDKLSVSRQQELAYIDEALRKCMRLYAQPEKLHEELFDLRGWLTSRRTCFRPGGSTNDAAGEQK